MVTLVADVGGTQSRLGLVRGGALDQASVRRFANQEFASFYQVVAQYLADANDVDVERCVIALAGPISAGVGSFTNLDWTISEQELKQVTKAKIAVLINDLTSLGYCLGKLPETSVSHITGPQQATDHNGQFLVIGMGTGFNVCPVLDDGTGRPVCLQVELGHTALASRLTDVLAERLPEYSVETIEDIFAGRGLSNLYRAVSGGAVKHGQDVVADHLSQSDAYATQTLELFAELLGLLVREVVVQYLPTGGIYFAGSVSRGIFGAGVTEVFERSFTEAPHFLKALDQFPIALITDDGAGLIGCGVRSEIAAH